MSYRALSALWPAAGLAACPPHPDAGTAARSAAETDAGARRCQRWTLTVVSIASGLLLFNVTAPNVALPAIADDLRAGGVPAVAGQRAGELAAAGNAPGAAQSLGPAGAAFDPVYAGAFVSALHVVFGVAIAIVAIGIVVVLALIRTARPATDPSTRRSATMRFEVAPRCRTSLRSP